MIDEIKDFIQQDILQDDPMKHDDFENSVLDI